MLSASQLHGDWREEKLENRGWSRQMFCVQTFVRNILGGIQLGLDSLVPVVGHVLSYPSVHSEWCFLSVTV